MIWKSIRRQICYGFAVAYMVRAQKDVRGLEKQKGVKGLETQKDMKKLETQKGVKGLEKSKNVGHVMKRQGLLLAVICLAVMLCVGCGSRRTEPADTVQNDREVMPEAGVEDGLDSGADSTQEADAGNGLDSGAGLTQDENAGVDEEGVNLVQGASVEAEDHVFSTWEAPLADGRTLRLEAVGKQVDEYNFGVREVRVYDEDTLIQTVLASEGYWQEDYTQCWSSEAAVEILDLNFDGSMDFGLFAWAPNNTIPFYYWTWDAGEGRYRYAGTLQGVELLPETEEVACSYRIEWGRYWTDYYRPNEDGELLLVRRETVDYTEKSGNDERGVEETWIPAEGESILSTREDDAPMDAFVLIRRRVPVAEIHDNSISYFWEIWEWKDGELQMTGKEEDLS